MSPNAEGRGGGGCRVSANEYFCAHGAQKFFGDLTPYLTYDYCTVSVLKEVLIFLESRLKQKMILFCTRPLGLSS
jgi:hypothetical protein